MHAATLRYLPAVGVHICFVTIICYVSRRDRSTRARDLREIFHIYLVKRRDVLVGYCHVDKRGTDLCVQM